MKVVQLSLTDIDVRRDGSLDLPARVPCLALWWDFAWLVAEGIKTLETRGYEAPACCDPGWLVVYATAGRGGPSLRPVLPEGVTVPADCPKQALTALVWVDGSWPLRIEDTAAACFYEPGRWAWPLSRRHKFSRPVPLAESGLKKGPQGLVYLARDVVERALLAP